MIAAYTDAYFGIPGGVFRMDASRLGAGYLDGEPVAVAPDVLGQGRAVQDVLAAMPTFVTNLNDSGFPALRFSGSQWMTLPDVWRLRTSNIFDIFFVAQRFGVALTDSTIMAWGSTNNERTALKITGHSSSRLLANFGGNRRSTNVGEFPTGGRFVIGVNSSVSASNVFVGEGAAHATAPGAFSSFDAFPPLLGARWNEATSEPAAFGNVAIQDIILFRAQPLTATQRLHITRRLARKWGITP